jgi:protein TonB
MSATVVSSSDRLSFTLFIALLLHALVVFGVTFKASDVGKNLSKTIEVTLASYKSDKSPQKADFLAQENQEGSGTLDEERMLTTDQETIFQSNSINETSLHEQQASDYHPRPIRKQSESGATAGQGRAGLTQWTRAKLT